MIQVMQQENIILRPGDKLPDLSTYDFLVCDTETSGLSSHHGDRICGIVIGPRSLHVGYYIPIRHPEGNLDLEEVLPWLQNLMNDPDRTWGFHNAKFDLAMLRADGIECRGQIMDSMLACAIFAGDELSYSLDAMTAKYVPGFKHEKYEALREYIHKTQGINISAKKNAKSINANYSLVPVEILGAYALEDLSATRLLFDALNNQTMFAAPDNYGNKSWGTRELIQNEMALCQVVMDVEYTGVLVDADKAVRLRDKTEDEIAKYEQKMFEYAGFSFNPGAYTQMTKALEAAGGEVLFWMKPENERSKQKSSAFTENKDSSTGRPCFNGVAIVQYLERFKAEGNTKAYEFMYALHEVDLRERILATYINPILKGLDKNNRLHCSLNQHRTVTGRFSSSSPNLQNQPKKGGSIDQKNFEKTLGVKDENAINRQIRSLFIAPPGHVLLSQDFSSIEYRAAAYLSRDEILLEKYRLNPRLDYHAEMAELAGVDRDLAKTCAFMILYGGGAKGLAATLTGMGRPYTTAMAQELINKIFTARPSLKNLIQEQVNISKRFGFVQTPYGRICPQIPGYEYAALNHLDQGMCGDMMRYAMVRIAALIKEKRLPAKMLLTIHDEILYEIPEQDVEWVAPILSEEMCKCEFMDIPVVADSEVGVNWKDQIPLEDWLTNNRKAPHTLAA